MVEQALRQAADLFHEIESAIAADDLIADCRNAKLADKLRENQRSHDQLKKIAVDGFELCTRAAIQRCADIFHAIDKALAAEDYRAQRTLLREISADGFELSVRELARLGATDVSIHECSERSMEEHW
jgi:hypothetical protein